MSTTIRFHKYGGPEVLQVEDDQVGEPGPGQVRLRQEAVGVNFIDTAFRQGIFPVPLPSVAGVEGAGVVDAVGAGVVGFRVGDRVAYYLAPGSYAAVRLIDAGALLKVPDDLSSEQVVTVLTKGLTAWAGLHGFHPLKAGETVLVQAGASGVGVAAIQLAKHAGATVLATASSDERLEALKPLGLDHGINYKTSDVVNSVMKLTNNKGVNLVVDSVGGSTLQGSILSLAYRGRVSMVGAAGREPMNVDVSSLMGGNRSLSGVFLGAEIGTDRAYNNIQRLINEAAAGTYKVVIDKTFPLSEAAAAHAYIESRQAVGRVLLIP